MLRRVKNLPSGVDGVAASGKVTREDYDQVLVPYLEELRMEGRRARLLYEFEADFDCFTASGAWEDLRVGMRYLRLFERCAVITDGSFIRDTTRIMAPLMPCPVRVFPSSERDTAIAWLSEPLSGKAATYRLDQKRGVLVVEPWDDLTAEDFDAIAMTVDPWIEQHGKLSGIVIHADRVPGWRNLGALVRHFQFVRDHHRTVRRVAVAADGVLAEILPRLAKHFVDAEIRAFAADDFADAFEWAASAMT